VAPIESPVDSRGPELHSRSPRVLVLGLGNLLLGDEGIGVHIAQLLQTQELGNQVEVLDVGTAILDSLPALELADRVIVIDAVKAGRTPGTVYRMPLSEFRAKSHIASMHGFDLQRALRLTRRECPPEVVVVGVEPEHIAWSLELSKPVEQALALALDTVKREIQVSN
jgi:hydrogenase maturation protease